MKGVNRLVPKVSPKFQKRGQKTCQLSILIFLGRLGNRGSSLVATNFRDHYVLLQYFIPYFITAFIPQIVDSTYSMNGLISFDSLSAYPVLL